MSTVITDYGLIKAVESLVKKINVANKIKINFTCKNCTSKLDIAMEMVLYRITEELINNTLKHSAATNAEIVIDINPFKIILEYSDNGVGCIVDEDLLDSKNGMGLKNIISRSKTINANYSFSNTMPDFHFNLDVEIK
jgi:signal transduction histidine kinase